MLSLGLGQRNWSLFVTGYSFPFTIWPSDVDNSTLDLADMSKALVDTEQQNGRNLKSLKDEVEPRVVGL